MMCAPESFGVLHRQSFVDDPTRIVRAVRYAGRLGFSIDDATSQLLSDALPAAMSTLSGDRIRHELDRSFREDGPLPVLRLADNLGVLSSIHPSLSVSHLSGVGTPDHPPAPLVWLAALMWSSPRNEAAGFSARVSAPSDWARVIEDTVALRERIDRLEEPHVSPSSVCAQLDGLAPEALSACRFLAPQRVSERIGQYRNEWLVDCAGPARRGPVGVGGARRARRRRGIASLAEGAT